MAEHFKLGVLLVDADPQCNASQLVLDEETLQQVYSAGAKRTSATKAIAPAQTLFDVLQPIAKGDASVAETIKPIRAVKNRFGVDIVPGHPRVALLEDRLSQAWVEFGGGVLGGARRTNWNTELLSNV